jgi:hypothetical protein
MSTVTLPISLAPMLFLRALSRSCWIGWRRGEGNGWGGREEEEREEGEENEGLPRALASFFIDAIAPA